MWCAQSPTKAAGGSTAAAASKPTGGIANLPRPKLDPKDFRFVELKGEAKVSSVVASLSGKRTQNSFRNSLTKYSPWLVY